MLASLLRRPKSARSPKPPRTRPTLTALEDRVVPYALSGLVWPSGNISVSYVPDGTSFDGDSSRLFAEFNAIAPTATWQREFARALQTWAEYSNVNFRFVADDGSPQGVIGICQGNSQFGDIRLGTTVLASNVLGYTHFPDTETTGFTDGGDLALNSAHSYAIGSSPDLYSITLHELGHALGLMHSTVGTVMYGAYSGVLTGLSSDDIAGIQAMYGARRQDAFDAAAVNNSLGTATPLTLSSGAVNVSADLTGRTDVDYYRVVASGSSLTVSVDARNLSLLAPKVLVYDAAGNLLGSATADYGQAATLSLTGLTAGQTYYLVADGATGDAFGTGAYGLDAQFGGGGSTVTAPQAPGGLVAVATTTTQVDLSWQDNSGNEDGFRVEQSTDGVNFTPVGTADANATSYTVTGLAADTTYYFRVQAVNGGGASAWSDIALAATPPEPTPVPPPAPPPEPPPPTLAPDRFEANETAVAARDLGKFNSTSQTALTINSSADVDWFTFTVNSSASFQVSITFAQAAGNLDLYVFDAQQRMMAGGTSASDNEAVSTSFTGGKQYYIKVVSPVGAENSYDLTITKLNGKNSRGGANLVLDLHGPDSLTTGGALVSGDPLPGSGSPTETGTTTLPPVADDGTGDQSGRPDSPGRSADSPGYRWSQSLRLLQDLDLPVRDGLADLLGVAGKLA